MLSRLKSALKRSPQDPPLVVEFDQRQSYTAGSTVSGIVHLQLTEDDAGGTEGDRKGKGRMRGGTGRKAIDQVVVRLRVLQVRAPLPSAPPFPSSSLRCSDLSGLDVSARRRPGHVALCWRVRYVWRELPRWS